MNAASYSGRRQWLHRWDKGDLGGGMAMREYQRVSERLRMRVERPTNALYVGLAEESRRCVWGRRRREEKRDQQQ